MSEQPTQPSETPAAGEAATKTIEERSMLRRAIGAARRHPGLTVLGAAGIGLFGGPEVAAAILIGAGVTAFVRGKAPAAGVRQRARAFADRAPGAVRERLRSVVQAARGKAAPEHGAPAT
jgi:hypothetical protein